MSSAPVAPIEMLAPEVERCAGASSGVEFQEAQKAEVDLHSLKSQPPRISGTVLTDKQMS